MASNIDINETMSHLSLEEDEACSFAMMITSWSVPPMVLKAVVDLDVLEIIKANAGGCGGYMSPEEIVAHLPAANRQKAAAMLDRMLRVLASYGVLTWQLREPTRPEGRVVRTYGLAPVCKFLTRNEDGAAISLMPLDKVVMESWCGTCWRGHMFVSIPKGDAIFMKWICHDWSDEHCIEFLKKSYEALPVHGKVIICDYILPVAPEANNAARNVFHCDAMMLTLNPGGKERTEAEFEYLAKASGFQAFKIACSAYDYKVIEFIK